MSTIAPTTQPSAIDAPSGQTASLSAEERRELSKTVSELVGQVFFGTLLRQFRAGQNRDLPLTGGRIGATYTSRLDQELLARLARSSRFAVGDELAQRWEPALLRGTRSAHRAG